MEYSNNSVYNFSKFPFFTYRKLIASQSHSNRLIQ
ncbi:hypothetical protein IEO70_10200 [Bacillus sp. AGMB 02131]|uniref:Uncharacterized protein n=1 Tax=Peribacillus faecalis TaxID=2772559 RepID=A0A927CVU9_9BACI|nr:hypothetical protein [Peribacillus faecalis]